MSSASSVLLMHGSNTCGCGSTTTRRKQKMALGKYSYKRSFNTRTGKYVKKRTRKRKRSMSGIGDMGKFDLRGSFDQVKEVLQTGVIAVVGSIVTTKVWDQVSKMISDKTMSPMYLGVANIITGCVLGIVVGKLTKKVKLGVSFAIGPVVSGMLTIFTDVMSPSSPTAGLNAITTIQLPKAFTEAPALPYGMSAIPTVRNVRDMDSMMA